MAKGASPKDTWLYGDPLAYESIANNREPRAKNTALLGDKVKDDKNVTGKYNRAGHTPREHYGSNDDPCGYMEESPCEFLLRANELIEIGLQKATEVAENPDSTHEQQGRAWQIYNLAREMSMRAGHTTLIPRRKQLVDNIQKVVNSIGG